MKRCEECGGRFGLVVYRYFARRFCRKRCRDRYLARQHQLVQSARERWLAYLSGAANANAP
jgi:hypothetical protein